MGRKKIFSDEERKQRQREASEKYYQSSKGQKTKKVYRQNNKETKSEKGKIYYQNNKEKINVYRENNKEYKKEWDKVYYQTNKRIMNEVSKVYRKNNKGKIKEWNKVYQQKNKGKINEYANGYHKKRYHTDDQFRARVLLRARFYGAMKQYSKTGKIKKSIQYGIDYEAIINHLKPFPVDTSKYHVDHIIPLVSFDLNDPEEIKKAFAPSNHQWLLAHDNIRKGKKIIVQEVLPMYLPNQKV